MWKSCGWSLVLTNVLVCSLYCLFIPGEKRNRQCICEKNKQGCKWNHNSWMAFLIFAVLWVLNTKKQKSHLLNFKSVVIQATWEWLNNVFVNSFSVYRSPTIINTINMAEFYLKCSLDFLLTFQNSVLCRTLFKLQELYLAFLFSVGSHILAMKTIEKW